LISPIDFDNSSAAVAAMPELEDMTRSTFNHILQKIIGKKRWTDIDGRTGADRARQTRA